MAILLTLLNSQCDFYPVSKYSSNIPVFRSSFMHVIAVAGSVGSALGIANTFVVIMQAIARLDAVSSATKTQSEDTLVAETMSMSTTSQEYIAPSDVIKSMQSIWSSGILSTRSALSPAAKSYQGQSLSSRLRLVGNGIQQGRIFIEKPSIYENQELDGDSQEREDDEYYLDKVNDCNNVFVCMA